ncbi:putative quinol monooxygenase [Nocardia transvalensis]|nr:putative quinol monooxygenase [Nocardia transvalensis]
MEPVVHVLADLTCRPEDAGRMSEVIERFAQACRREPGCLSYDVFRSVEQPERFLSVEQYADREAFAAHRNSDHFREIGQGELLAVAVTRTVRTFTGAEPVPPKA